VINKLEDRITTNIPKRPEPMNGSASSVVPACCWSYISTNKREKLAKVHYNDLHIIETSI